MYGLICCLSENDYEEGNMSVGACYRAVGFGKLQVFSQVGGECE